MKITRISAYQVDLALADGPYNWSGGNTVSVFDSTIVRVDTDAGVSGYGEACPFGPAYLPAYAEGARTGIAMIERSLLGLDPRQSSVNQRGDGRRSEGVSVRQVPARRRLLGHPGTGYWPARLRSARGPVPGGEDGGGGANPLDVLGGVRADLELKAPVALDPIGADPRGHLGRGLLRDGAIQPEVGAVAAPLATRSAVSVCDPKSSIRFSGSRALPEVRDTSRRRNRVVVNSLTSTGRSTTNCPRTCLTKTKKWPSTTTPARR